MFGGTGAEHCSHHDEGAEQHGLDPLGAPMPESNTNTLGTTTADIKASCSAGKNESDMEKFKCSQNSVKLGFSIQGCRHKVRAFLQEKASIFFHSVGQPVHH